jgi:integrase
MGTLYQRGKKRIWWIKFYRSGKPFYESSRSTKKRVAQDLLKTREGQVTDGRFTGLRADRVRFEEMADDLLNDQQVNGNRSAAWTKRRVDDLKSFFGGRRAVEITTVDVRRYVKERQDQSAAPATINRELAALKRMFNLAVQAGKLYHKPYVPMLQEDNVRKGFLGEIEYLALREVLPNPLNDMLDFAYKYGWRKTEVLSLRWEQVDFSAGTVRLEPGTTKNREARTVVLTAELLQMLKRRLAETRALSEQIGQPVPWVFHRRGKPVRDFRGAWKTACKAAGVQAQLFHDLRRSAVRNMIRLGISEPVAMKISGHKTRSVFDRYNIVSEGDLREAAKKLSGVAGGTVENVTENVTAPVRSSPIRPNSSVDAAGEHSP